MGPKRQNRGKARPPTAPYRRRKNSTAPGLSAQPESAEHSQGESTQQIQTGQWQQAVDERLSALERRLGDTVTSMEKATTQLERASKALEASMANQGQSQTSGPYTLERSIENQGIGNNSIFSNDTDATTPQTVREKIQEDKFIELSSLLKMEDNGDRPVRLIEVGGESHLVVKGARVKTLSYTQWCQAFNILRTIRQRGDSEIGEALGQHFHIIAKMFEKRQNWELYDRKMRMMIAEGKEKWGVFNMILAWECQTPSNTSGTAQQGMEGQKRKICWAYNAGQCSHHKCKFLHQCSVCKKHGHPETKCYKKSNNSNQSFRGNNSNGNRTQASRGGKTNDNNTNQK